MLQDRKKWEVSMDSAVSNALKRREEIREELSEIERFLKLYDKFKEPSARSQGVLELRGVRVESPSEQNEESSPPVPRRGWTREMLRPHLRSVILAAGRPLTRSGLLKALDEREIHVGGTNRSKNMGTIMWRLSNDFVSLEGFGYWPRDTAYPPASYDPEDLNSPEAITHTLGGRPLEE
jgi:hypothetical protein